MWCSPGYVIFDKISSFIYIKAASNPLVRHAGSNFMSIHSGPFSGRTKFQWLWSVVRVVGGHHLLSECRSTLSFKRVLDQGPLDTRGSAGRPSKSMEVLGTSTREVKHDVTCLGMKHPGLYVFGPPYGLSVTTSTDLSCFRTWSSGLVPFYKGVFVYTGRSGVRWEFVV